MKVGQHSNFGQDLIQKKTVHNNNCLNRQIQLNNKRHPRSLDCISFRKGNIDTWQESTMYSKKKARTVVIDFRLYNIRKGNMDTWQENTIM